MKRMKKELEERREYNKLLKWYLDNFDKLTSIKTVNGKVKMFGIPETIRFKKIKTAVKKVMIGLNILSLLLIFACGSDNPINNGNNPPPASNDSLVFAVDSLSVWGNGVNTSDTTLFNVFQTNDSVKVSFNTSTNCTSSDTGYISITCGNILSSLSTFNMQGSYTLYGKYETFGTALALYLKSTSLRYLKLSNVKFYKVNPV